MKKILFLLFLALISTNSIFTLERLEIYYNNYKRSRVGTPTHEDHVRDDPDSFMIIRDASEVSLLKELLKNQDEYKKNERFYKIITIYIVIDLIEDDQVKETYIMNHAFFYRKGDTQKYRTPKILLEKLEAIL